MSEKPAKETQSGGIEETPRPRSRYNMAAPAPPPPKPPLRKATATPTSILCELMRLKAQQKYLECNQVKLNASNFLDDNDLEEGGMGVGEDKPRRPSSGNKVAGLINDIDRLKLELDEKRGKHHGEKRGQLQDMWHSMQCLKDDVFRPERLSQCTVNAVRERIIALNAQLERLSVQNAKELEQLRHEYDKLEKDNSFVWKGSI